mmetsp:Transcript_49775/g.115522  ORF Transcript_49775/g.115522 Transcript_49775/m.115522 type:complete len:305 (-) Transcript_49775:16-930(-)
MRRICSCSPRRGLLKGCGCGRNGLRTLFLGWRALLDLRLKLVQYLLELCFEKIQHNQVKTKTLVRLLFEYQRQCLHKRSVEVDVVAEIGELLYAFAADAAASYRLQERRASSFQLFQAFSGLLEPGIALLLHLLCCCQLLLSNGQRCLLHLQGCLLLVARFLQPGEVLLCCNQRSLARYLVLPATIHLGLQLCDSCDQTFLQSAEGFSNHFHNRRLEAVPLLHRNAQRCHNHALEHRARCPRDVLCLLQRTGNQHALGNDGILHCWSLGSSRSGRRPHSRAPRRPLEEHHARHAGPHLAPWGSL